MIKKEISLILDNIRSRENVGSIFRTADAAGVSRIYLCGITPVPSTGNPNFEILNPKQFKISKFKVQNQDKIAKTALGAEKTVPYEYIRDTWRIVTKLKKEGIVVVVLEQTKDSIDIFSLKPNQLKTKSLALIVGNEVNGISSRILKYCDKMVEIPMYGKKESLNVSVATGVALYALRNNK